MAKRKLRMSGIHNPPPTTEIDEDVAPLPFGPLGSDVGVVVAMVVMI